MNQLLLFAELFFFTSQRVVEVKVTMDKWYVVHTKPNREQVALNNLENQGYKCFLPKIKAVRIRRSKRVFVEEPFFYCYLFINLDLDSANIGPIRSTFGVRGLVRFGSYHPEISDEFIENLYILTDSSGILSLPPPDFKPGQTVQIKSGPLRGYDAIFLANSNKERAMLLIDVIGTEKCVSVPVLDLI